MYLEKEEIRIVNRKKKKLQKLLTNDNEKLEAPISRFEEHFNFYNFKTDLLSHAEIVSPDIQNLVNLILLGTEWDSTPNSVSDKHDAGDSNSENSETLTFNSVNTENLSFNSVNIENLTFNSIDTVCDVNNEGRFVGKFVSPNVINLSGRVLSEAEISLLSKGLKFCPTPNGVNKAVLKEELEVFGRRLRLMWHFRDEEENNTTINPFRPKSKFNPKGKDVSI